MHPKLRQLLGRRDIAVMRYKDTPRARRIALLRSQGVTDLLDVGANVGQYGSDVRSSGYAGRILSVEPIESAFSALQQAAAGDPTWRCGRAAVGAEVGELAIHVSENSIFSSALPATDAMLGTGAQTHVARTEMVPLTTLDSLVAEQVASSGVLGVKVDVQGFEGEVLRGGQEALARAAWFEMELALTTVYEGGLSLREALDVMYGSGFELACVENLMPDRPSGRALQANGIFVRVRP